MTAVGVQSKILALFLDTLANGGLNPGLNIAYPGIDFPAEGQVKPDKYLRTDIMFNPTRTVAYDGPQQIRGIFEVTVYWIRNVGLIQPLNYAGQIIKLFNSIEDRTLFVDGIKVVINAEPWAASPIQNVDRVSVPVTIPWYAFEPEV